MAHSRIDRAEGREPGSWPKRPARLSTPVVAAIVDRVVSGEFAAGSTLPPEPDLCERFAISRTVVREAIKSVEAMRLVHARQGRGTTVRGIEEWDLLNEVVLAAIVHHDAELSILDDLTDVRIALEGQMAGQAAGRISGETLARLRSTLDALHDAEGDHDRFTELDALFHGLIMASSGNRLGRAVIRTVATEALQSHRYIGEPTDADRMHSNQGHEAIYEALQRGDADAARQAMECHISESWARRRPARPRSDVQLPAPPGDSAQPSDRSATVDDGGELRRDHSIAAEENPAAVNVAHRTPPAGSELVGR